MTPLQDLLTPAASGLNYIDAVLGTANWNYITTSSNVIYYTFSVSEGIQADAVNLTAFNAAQQTAVRSALDYVQALTGIEFAETTSGAQADFHFANQDLSRFSGQDFFVGGWTSANDYYSYVDDLVTEYRIDAYVYLDNGMLASWYAAPSAGTRGYEDLLHEIGHALGLKHPFEGTVQLPAASDNTANTLMSYTHTGGPYAAFQAYDIAALNFIYGGDGLLGTRGVGTSSPYFTGTNAAERASIGSTSGKVLDGSGGIDVVAYDLPAGAATVSRTAGGDYVLQPAQALLGDTLINIERLELTDRKLALDLAPEQNAGKAVLMIGAVFGAAALTEHQEYLGIGLQCFDAGYSTAQIAEVCIANGLLGATDNAAFVSTLWQNITGSPIDAASLAYFSGWLQGSGGTLSQASLLELAALSSVNIEHVDLPGLAASGVEYF